MGAVFFDGGVGNAGGGETTVGEREDGGSSGLKSHYRVAL